MSWSIKDVSEVAQSCPALCNPMDYSLPGSSVHGIFQARVLEQVAISFSKGSSQPRDQTRVSRIVGRCFTVWAMREAQVYKCLQKKGGERSQRDWMQWPLGQVESYVFFQVSCYLPWCLHFHWEDRLFGVNLVSTEELGEGEGEEKC